jgi:choline dehydrogenase
MWNRVNADKLRFFANNLGLAPYSSFHVNLNVLRPDCDGSVQIVSTDPGVAPRIEYEFRFSDADVKAALHGIKTTRKLMAMPVMRTFVQEESAPGPSLQTDEELVEFCRNSSGCSMHSVGSCRMGVVEGAVVDPRLRVRGVSGLRIADASIMPTLVRGGTNPAAVMIGEKAAMMILEEARSGVISDAA